MTSGASWVVTFLILLAPAPPAEAYIDPGSGSLLLQLLVAGGIAAVIRFRAFLRASIGRLFGARKK